MKGGEDDDKGMVNDIDGVESLGEMSRSIRDGICVCVVVVVVVVVLMVAMGVVVLMVVVGIAVFVMVVRVSCIGVVGVVGVLRTGALEVYCAGVVDILELGGVLVVKVVEGVKLVVGCVVKRFAKLVLGCVNGRGYFLCSFNLKLVEMNGLSVDGFLFGMVI